MKFLFAMLLLSLIAAGDMVFAFATAARGSPSRPCACGASCRCAPDSCCGPEGTTCLGDPEHTPAPAMMASAANETTTRHAAGEPLPRHLGALCLLAQSTGPEAAWGRVLEPGGSAPGNLPIYLLDSALLL